MHRLVSGHALSRACDTHLVVEKREELAELLRIDLAVAVPVQRPENALQLILLVLASITLPG